MEPVDAIVVLSFKLDPERIADVLHAIDPPRLPHFAGQARIAVGTDAAAVIDWLEGRADTLPTTPCPKCLANSEDGEPWHLTVVDCPECKGTGPKP